MKKVAFLILAISIMFFIGCSNSTSKPLKEDDKVELETADNKKIAIKKTKEGFLYLPSRTLILTFFTKSCIPCKAQIPYLNNLQNRYSDELRVVSVILDYKESEDIRNFLINTNPNFTVAFTNNAAKLSAAFGNITSVPYTVIYDKDGAYVNHYTGAVPEEMIEADLKRIF